MNDYRQNIHTKLSICLLMLLAIVSIIVLARHSPIPQPIAYSNFADQRMFMGIPNFWNVMSNIPFSIIGIMGLYFLFKHQTHVKQRFINTKERYAYIIFFIAIFLIGFGSAYYHWHPNNQTLVWDRLPMSLAFMAFFAAMISERINTNAGVYLLAPLIALGLASVIYWHYTDDLRPYIFIQFFPMIALPLLFLLFPTPYTNENYLFSAFIFYLLAKIFELYDRSIFISLHHFVSGHTLKHIAAAIAMLCIALYIGSRKIKKN